MTAVEQGRPGEKKPRLREQLRARTGNRQLPTRGRAYGQLAAGVLVLLVGALVGAWVFTQSGATTSVLAVGSPVAKGEVIERDDLVSKQVAGVDGTIAVEDVNQVLGATAAVDLTEGQVITENAITPDPVPGTGESVVGLSLTTAQMPGSALAAGDIVQVVSVPAADEATAGVAEATVLAARAQVLSVAGGGEGSESRNVVTVVVPQGESSRLAAASASGRAAVIKIPAGQAEAAEEGGGEESAGEAP